MPQREGAYDSRWLGGDRMARTKHLDRHETSVRHAEVESAVESAAPVESAPEQGFSPTPLAGRAYDSAPVDVRRVSDPLGGTTVTPDVDSALRRRRGKGSALPASLGDRVGDAMNADFSGVRVHTDSEADAIARSVASRAFTFGHDIYFTTGTYAPATSSGQHMLAHELAHVAQHQRGASSGPSGPATIGLADDHAEREADHAATDVVAALRRQA